MEEVDLKNIWTPASDKVLEIQKNFMVDIMANAFNYLNTLFVDSCRVLGKLSGNSKCSHKYRITFYKSEEKR